MARRGHDLAVAENDTQRHAGARERVASVAARADPFPSPRAVAGTPVPMSDSDAADNRSSGGRDRPVSPPSLGERDAATFAHAGGVTGVVTQAAGLYQLLVESVRD